MSETAMLLRWGKVPAWWLLHPGMDRDGFAVMALLATYADKDGRCRVSQNTLARRLRVSRPWINRVIGELAALEPRVLHKEERQRADGATTSCDYHIIRDVPDNMVAWVEDGEEPASAPARQRADAPRQRADTPRQPADAPRQRADRIQNPLNQNPDSRRARATEDLPSDWQPSNDALLQIGEVCPDADVAEHVAVFVAKSRSRGYRYLNADDAFVAWVIEDERRMRFDRTSGRAVDPAAARFDAWRMAASVAPGGH